MMMMHGGGDDPCVESLHSLLPSNSERELPCRKLLLFAAVAHAAHTMTYFNIRFWFNMV